MTEIYTIVKEWVNELRDGIAWLIVWKTGRSWNTQVVQLPAADLYLSQILAIKGFWQKQLS